VTLRSVRSYARSFGGGAPCRCVEIHADELALHRLQAPSRIRARDVAHLYDRLYHPNVETLALPPHTVRASAAPAALQRHGDETYLSLRAALSAYWARTEAPEREASAGRRGDDVGRFLTVARRRGSITTHRPSRDGEGPTLTVPVGTLGYLRHVGHFLPTALLLNTHFFLFDPTELDSPFAAVGDPVGMLATHGQIRQPPILPRATLIRSGAGWSVRRLGVDDLAIDLPDGTTVLPGTSGASSLRYRGQGAAGERAPASEATLEVLLQGRSATVLASGGGLTVPHGAIALSFTSPPGPGGLRALWARPTVGYRIPAIPDLVTAVQAGPQLLADGEAVVRDASFGDERFRTLGAVDATAPLVFPADHDRTRAGRVGIGVTRTNSLVIVAVQGTSSSSATGPDRPTGCTLSELAEALAEAGAVDALNCDGGGSAQVFRGAGAVLASSDSRAVGGALFDRPVPVAACVR
jgi:hypothetical protein